MRTLIASVLIALSLSQGAHARPAEPVEPHPAGVGIRISPKGQVLADAGGRTLYAMNLRFAFARGGDGLKFCTGACAEAWSPLVAAPDAAPMGDWTIVNGAQGRQWAFKRNPVFTYRAETAPGQLAGDGYEDMWAAITYVPPAPALVAPAGVVPSWQGTAWVLADPAGHALYTARAGQACSGGKPFASGMAARPVGGWAPLPGADCTQWSYRGKPVFISEEAASGAVPEGGAALRP